MRKFSTKEQEIIRSIVKANGISLHKILSDVFGNNGRIEINLETGKLRVFTPKNVDYEHFIREFNLKINLIAFLQNEGLMYHYSTATVLSTSMCAFGGYNGEEKESIFIPSNQMYIVEFLRTHHGVTFEANETLKVLCGNAFKTDDEIRYEETNRISSQNLLLSKKNISVAILIAIVSSFVQVGIAVYQNCKQAESMTAINSLEMQLYKLSNRVKADSTEILKLKERNQVLEITIRNLAQGKANKKLK